MPSFGDEFISELKQRNDIVAVVERYVDLSRSSSSHLGLCPFHNEKTPSFHVNPAKQFFYCFGCHTGGDVITFLMKIENLSYAEAVQMLADRVGMTVPRRDTFDNEITQLRKRVFEMNRVAARFFYDNLQKPEGRGALEYFLKRGLTPQTITRFGLGYSLDSWDGLLRHLQEKGYDLNDIKASGLVVSNERRLFDRFRNRAMFPIIDHRGNVIAFGGRAMTEDDPAKYLNSSDNVGFKKGNNLYALNLAKNQKDGRLILCEGYMDVIAMHQAGFNAAVATLGTALTTEQAQLLKRFTDHVSLCYDSDAAGIKATKRAADILTSVGLGVSIVSLSGGKDPDEIIKKHGKEYFAKLLDGSMNQLDFRINEVLYQYNLNVESEKYECAKALFQILAAVPSDAQREIYIDKVARDLAMDRNVVKTETQQRRRKLQREQKKKDDRQALDKLRGVGDRVNPQRASHLRAARLEEDLIGVLIHFPEKAATIRKYLDETDFVTDFNRRIYIALNERLTQNPDVEPMTALSALFSAEEIGKITAFTLTCEAYDVTDQKIEDIALALKQEHDKVLKAGIGISAVVAHDMQDHQEGT